MLFSSALTLVPLALSTLGAVAESRNRAVHASIAKRSQNHNATEISKRAYTSSRWSFYDVGLGACGETNVNSDYIVALNQEQFGTSYPSSYCGKKITMSYNGKTATATIMDSCPGCPYGALDLSRGLFNHFASEDTGIIYGTWSIVGDSDKAAATTTTAKATPTTTSKYTPPATTKQAQATTTKKSTPTTTHQAAANDAAVTTTSHHASSTKKAAAKATDAWSSSYAAASASSASLASSFASIKPSATATANSTVDEIQKNLDALESILAQLGSLIVQAIPDAQASATATGTASASSA